MLQKCLLNFGASWNSFVPRLEARGKSAIHRVATGSKLVLQLAPAVVQEVVRQLARDMEDMEKRSKTFQEIGETRRDLHRSACTEGRSRDTQAGSHMKNIMELACMQSKVCWIRHEALGTGAANQP